MNTLAAAASAEQQKINDKVRIGRWRDVDYPSFIETCPPASGDSVALRDRIVYLVKVSAAHSSNGRPAFQPRGSPNAYYMPVLADANTELTGDLLALLNAYDIPGQWAADQTKVLVRMPDGTIALIGIPPMLFQLLHRYRPSILQPFAEQIVYSWSGGMDGFRFGFVAPHLAKLPCSCYLWARNVPDPDTVMRLSVPRPTAVAPDNARTASNETQAPEPSRPSFILATPFLGPNGKLHIAVPVGIDGSNVHQWFESLVGTGHLAPAPNRSARYSVSVASNPIRAGQDVGPLQQATDPQPGNGTASRGKWVTLTPHPMPPSAGQDATAADRTAAAPAQEAQTKQDKTIQPAPAARRVTRSTTGAARAARLARSRGPAAAAATARAAADSMQA